MKTFIVQMSHGGSYKVKADQVQHLNDTFVFMKDEAEVATFSKDKVDCFYEQGGSIIDFSPRRLPHA